MKKSYYCEKLEKTIHFLPDAIKFCCTGAEGPGVYGVDFGKFSVEKVENAKRKIINSLMRGNIPKQCYGCTDYKEQPAPGFCERFWGVKSLKKINHIIIDHFKECDCNCIYCSQKIIYPEKVKEYDILPIIKTLYANNMIDEEVEVEFQGGSVGIWNEYQSILNEFLKRNCKHFWILTNGVVYEPMIKEIAETAHVNISISLDCGTAEKFKEIKRTDKFDTVIENIGKYKQTKAGIALKYILLKDVNDNKEEIEHFLNISRALACPVKFDADYREVFFGNTDKYSIPPHFIELTDFARAYCDEHKMSFVVNPALQYQIDKAAKKAI